MRTIYESEKAPLSSSVSLSPSEAEEKKFRLRRRPRWTNATEKYWLSDPLAKDQRWARYIVLIGMATGFCIALGLATWGYFIANRARYVLVMHDVFDDFSTDNWLHEQQLGGYIEGSFDWTTDSVYNSWVSEGMLHIKPTILQEFDNLTFIDLTAQGVCTSLVKTDCYAIQNLTDYESIPTIQTARIRSRKSITFGKVEVTAKLPAGDWIFPTIGLDPEDLIYGHFPASGGIDIVQSRGNPISFISGGRNKIDSIVHFGADGHPYTDQANWARNRVKLSRSEFSAGFHTFGLEWTPTYIRTWLDYPSNTILEVKWPKGFWPKADYARYTNDVNYKYLADPWTNGSLAAPYDVPFHLTLRSNVGAVNGMFADVTSKPWYDGSGRGAAMIAFQDNTTWVDSWGMDAQHTMYIKEVKMWQQMDAKVAN